MQYKCFTQIQCMLSALTLFQGLTLHVDILARGGRYSLRVSPDGAKIRAYMEAAESRVGTEHPYTLYSGVMVHQL